MAGVRHVGMQELVVEHELQDEAWTSGEFRSRLMHTLLSELLNHPQYAFKGFEEKQRSLTTGDPLGK